jgi:hypothetical protein
MRCANCDAELVGAYCHACGQRAIGNDDLAVVPVMRQFADHLVHLDFKTLRSLALLLVPGLLTQEFLDGRRRRYLSPLKLYFIAAALFFVTAPFIGFSLFDLLRSDEAGAIEELVSARVAERGMDMTLFAERYDARSQTVMTLSYGVSIFVTAFVLKALFRTHSLGAHLVFSLHYVSFLYLVAIVLSAGQKLLGGPSPLLSMVFTYAVVVPYLFVGLQRVYRQTPRRTIVKVLVLCAITFVVDLTVSFGAILLTLWLV